MFFRKNHLAPPTILLHVALPEATSGGQCTPTKQDVDLGGASVQELGGRQARRNSGRKGLGGTQISSSSRVPSEGEAGSSFRPKSPEALPLCQPGNRLGCLMSLILPFRPKAWPSVHLFRWPVRAPAVPIRAAGRVPSPGVWSGGRRSGRGPAS